MFGENATVIAAITDPSYLAGALTLAVGYIIAGIRYIKAEKSGK